ncbi:alpha/beta hydrolase [Actinoplanes sp. KI2]|uniref:alpha/beta hydrolase fold domain-containing protein n=1 Tax=Actinoplanes sp. KI2 TaxID=2983315 RepID=UPI0021D5BBBA|nr:alpha/beta hydrolase [Actinoplanes sp. KI2]MCU7725525.1 alpha/beta hydrolase [Actinoplanes sp. KI2]
MDAIEELYAEWTAGTGRGGGDHWGDVTGEPGGVDYLEVSAGGVPAMWLRPHDAAPGRAIMAVHGGGFVGGSLYSHRKMYGHLAKAVGVPVLLTTYRHTPEFRYPAQLDDVVTAYRWLRAQGLRTVLAADSAGAQLVVYTALRVPGAEALLLISPWLDTDRALAAASYDTNAATDTFFTRPMIRALIDAYLPDGVSGTDPAVNAFHADLSGLPPVFVQAGGAEGPLGEGERLAERVADAGVEARLDVFPGRLHSFQMAAGYSTEADEAIGRFAAWTRPKLGL